MKVLVACEESQAVTIAFRERGHEAFSCDLQECSGGFPGWHIQGDAVVAMYSEGWDLVIAFPPCTDLAVSGARWFPEKRANGSQAASIKFFMGFVSYADQMNVPMAIENPIGVMSSVWRKPDQIIQPWQYGHGETKSTCLWLKGLPKLQPTDIVEGREGKVWRMTPGPERAKLRSKTYPGIAKAMAEQWGVII